MPTEFSARVLANRALAPGLFVLELADCEPLVGCLPGQFVMVRGEWGRDPLLPRAFSLLSARHGKCELLIKALGRGSRLLERSAVGATLQLLGPLGRPFPVPRAERRDFLIAGGVGLAPLLWHAEEAVRAGAKVELFYGARQEAELVLRERIEATGCRVQFTTEDGSFGRPGRVTAALQARLDEEHPTLLTCGPNAMMRAVVEIARARNLACFVSVEGEMACGIGACLGCAVQSAPGAARAYHYACIDGPVFDALQVVLP